MQIMVVCEGTGGSGELIVKDGWDDWWVKCPVCGTTWMGGSADNLPQHNDNRAPRSQSAQTPPDPYAAARQSEAKLLADGRRQVQGIGTAFGDYLELLGIMSELSDFERGVFFDEADRIALDAASVDELVAVLRDFLPDCWTPMVWRGYAAPDYCKSPLREVCDTCQSTGKRPPRYRPQRP